MKRRRSTINRVRDMQWTLDGLRELRAANVPIDYNAHWLRQYGYSIGKQYGLGRWRFLRHRLHVANRAAFGPQ